MQFIKKIFLLVIFSYCQYALGQNNDQPLHPSQEKFWNALNEICGKSFSGEVAEAPDADTTFNGKKLIMHVRACEEGKIYIPFIVENDLSRTWVISIKDGGLELKHDHRHQNGEKDRITNYGGKTPNSGRATVQYFPADQETVDLLPSAAGNVWWIEMVPGKHFSYNLGRIGTAVVYRIRFDLNNEVETPPAPWGWEEKK
jgi:hypothetical protein